jgi:hypothetical protein
LVQTQIYNEVYLELGKPLNLDAILKDESKLSEVMVTGAKSKVLVASGRTGGYNRKKESYFCFTTISRSAEILRD